MSTDARQRLAALSVEDRNALAQWLSRRSAPGVSTAPTAIPRRAPGDDPLPLSYAQQRFWLLTEMSSQNAAYNVGGSTRLRGQLDTAALRRAFNEVIRRHEVLRSTFEAIDGRPVQRIHKELTLPLEVVDVSGAPDVAAAVKLESARLRSEPWNLRTGPLVRATLVRAAQDDHVLLFMLHHIISDGWSTTVLAQQIADLYAAYSTGQEPTLAPPPIQYGDFSVWQHQWLESEHASRQVAFWKGYMADAPVLQLPRDRGSKITGTHHWVVIPEDLTRAVRALAQREGATLFMLFLAALGSLLTRYGGQEEVVIGSPTANRTRPELEQLLGCFMNPVPMRVDARQDPTFRQLLKRVREGCIAAFANQELPFDYLVRTLQPRRDASTPPLFQAMLLVHNFLRAISLEGTGMKTAPISVAAPELAALDGWKCAGDLIYPVALEVVDLDTKLVACFEYADMYAPTVGNMWSHLLTFLTAVTANPDVRLSDVPVMAAGERQTLLNEWSRNDSEYPAAFAHQLFEAQVRRTPDAVAVDVVTGGERVTYAELNARANQLARHLRELGAARGTFVGLALTRSIDLIAALMAVLKTGAAYVPLDPAYPASRLGFIADDTAMRLLVTTRRVLVERPELDRSGLRVVCLDEEQGLARHDASDPGWGVDGSDAAYVIYTSGSTGTPKGVAVPHRAIGNYTQAAADRFAITAEDRVLQFASISFDTAAEEIYPCLSRGAALVLRSDAMIASATVFLRECGEERITILDLPTAYWHEIAAQICQQELPVPESLRYVILGGEEARPDITAAWQARFGERMQLLNTYGPTEATIVATTYDVPRPGAEAPSLGVPIGRPVAGARTYILDGRGRPVSAGVAGELHIGGVGLALGYLNRPELSAEMFVPDPFSGTPGARLYRTGDLARYLSDGTIEFLGRADRQVKLHGFRIEPGEIESVLTSDPAVAQAVVVIREDRPGDRRLVAYVVPAPGASVVAAELRRLAKDRLPEHMVPSAVVELPALPLTQNGKLDRSALPAPDGARQSEEAYIPPRNDLERRIAAIWCEVLGVQSVGVDDNFFDLGGHSMLVVRLHARLRADIGGELTVVDIFRFPTVAALARQLTTNDDAGSFADDVRDRARKQREAMARRRKAGAGPGLATL